MRRPIVVANWKMHGSLKENTSWFEQFVNLVNQNNLNNLDIAIAPSFVYLTQISQYIAELSRNKISNIYLAAQDISNNLSGAYTGQVSVDMIQDFATKYVILGHSERRALCFENDNLIAQKARLVLSKNLCPIVCLGETLEERQANKTNSVITKQLEIVLDEICDLIKNQNLDNISNLIIAYEPVWAIGTGLNATPEQAQEVHYLIREQLSNKLSAKIADKIRIIYGGSVKPNNAKDLFNQPDIDGGLIGGASLDANMFFEICKIGN